MGAPIILDPATAQDYVKKPGQWRRKGENGPPVVTDPDGLANKDGTVKKHTYSRPSSVGKQVENTYNLQRWNERQGIIGVASDDEILAEMRALLEQGDRDSKEWKAATDVVFTKAKRAAGAFLKADQGTHGHTITEDGDLDRDIVARIADGENVGIPEQVQRQILEAWNALVADKLEILAVEFATVHDEWRVAGTGDRLARCLVDLSFVVEGETVVIPAGTIIVLDIKTGGLKTDRNGRPNYWLSYAVQVAAYAGGVPYDVDTERRGEWPFEISQDHAVIAHIDIGRALETGEMVAQLIYVDLTAGRQAGDLVCACKEWQKRRDVFSPVGQHVVNVGTATPSPLLPDRRTTLRARWVSNIKGHPDLEARWAELKIDPDDLDAVEAAIDELDPLSWKNTAPARAETAAVVAAEAAKRVEPPTPVVVTPPDEGGPGDVSAFKILEARFVNLNDKARAWIAAIARGAQVAGVPFGAGDQKTVRRFEIYRGLLTLCDVGGWCDDEIVREVIATVMDSDDPFMPSFTTGHIVGAMSADEAAQFACLVSSLCDDNKAVALRLRPAA